MTAPTGQSRVRKHLRVRGVVQGVGFRPFVYNLARSLDLSGYVLNSSAGVTIEIEGAPPQVQAFLEKLHHDRPPLAQIDEVLVSDKRLQASAGFSILDSLQAAGEFSLAPADAGTCEACWRDFTDPANRRFGYPFTNCTHCGPRYTILRGLPYDRVTTTMASFKMCSLCQAEYDNPEDRRFHAQPNACAVCGPSLLLVKNPGWQTSPPPAALAALGNCWFNDRDSLSILHQTRSLLQQGNIVAVKGLGGFLLACDAANEQAVAELRKRKHRPHKPFALMVRDLDAAKRLCELSAADEASLSSARRPIVILPRRPDAKVAAGVAPGDRTLGILLPYTPLHYLLFSDSPENVSPCLALVMTSGNLSEEPIVISNNQAMAQLGGVADWFLLHNRDIATRVDDSVVRTFEGQERVLRRARGFVPAALDVGMAVEEVLAFGGELKNTFCLTRDHYAILSQHIGDLENYETMCFFEETLGNLKKIFKVNPRAAAHDLHPGYMSTRMAMNANLERSIGVQHHHAHIASCMAENHLQDQVLGVALDGTGFGTDGRIWGGEFMLAGYDGFTRLGHLRNVLLPGGDAAVRQPWRMALSYLRDCFGAQLPQGLNCFDAVDQKQLGLVDAMLTRRIQTVETSSCGRLFDAVAALLGIAPEVTFEGQAAIALEAAAGRNVDQRYEFEISGQPMQLDLRPAIAQIARDAIRRRPVGEISAAFHNTLSAAIGEMCSRAKGPKRVCLSGGSFANLYLVDRTVVELRRRGFAVFLHSQVPANDGGLSLGQAMIANQRLRGGD